MGRVDLEMEGRSPIFKLLGKVDVAGDEDWDESIECERKVIDVVWR